MGAHARELVSKFSVKTPRLDTPIKNLSGGNIQKLIMARELSRQPDFYRGATHARSRHRRDGVHPFSACWNSARTALSC